MSQNQGIYQLNNKLINVVSQRNLVCDVLSRHFFKHCNEKRRRKKNKINNHFRCLLFPDDFSKIFSRDENIKEYRASTYDTIIQYILNSCVIMTIPFAKFTQITYRGNLKLHLPNKFPRKSEV